MTENRPGSSSAVFGPVFLMPAAIANTGSIAPDFLTHELDV